MTTLLAATATDSHGSLLPLFVVGMGAAAVYAGLCWLRPFRRCLACSGTAVRGRRGRPCWWCGGAGQRLRLGRRAFNALARRRRSVA